MKLLVKPKGKKKKIIEVPDDEVPVRPKVEKRNQRNLQRLKAKILIMK